MKLIDLYKGEYEVRGSVFLGTPLIRGVTQTPLAEIDSTFENSRLEIIYIYQS
jgi:hypothetical protein